MTDAGAIQFHCPAQTTTKISAMFSADATAMIAIGTGVSEPDASPIVRFAIISAEIAPRAGSSDGPRFLTTKNHASAYAPRISAATTFTGDHSEPTTHAHAKITIDAAIAPAACSSPERTASDVAVSASVRTVTAPNSGHGGIDQPGSIAMK